MFARIRGALTSIRAWCNYNGIVASLGSFQKMNYGQKVDIELHPTVRGI